MNIDILIGVALRGGVENVINMVSGYLISKGHKVCVVQLVWEGVKWTTDSIDFEAFFEGLGSYNIEEFISAYSNRLTNKKPDIILATVWPYTCYIAKKALAYNNMNIPVVYWPHHGPLSLYEKRGFGGYSYVALSDAQLALSDSIYKELENNIPGTHPYRIYNPIDLDALDKETPFIDIVNSDKKKMIFVGRISEEKRIDVIIKALGRTLGKWDLYIVGEAENSEIKEKLSKLCVESGVTENVFFLGWQKQPFGIAESMDICILASEYESFSLTTVEAMALGLPVISTPTSGAVELIKPGVNGYLYPFGDHIELANILLAISDGIFPKIDKNKCREVAERFDCKKVLPEFEQLINKIVLENKKI